MRSLSQGRLAAARLPPHALKRTVDVGLGPEVLPVVAGEAHLKPVVLVQHRGHAVKSEAVEAVVVLGRTKSEATAFLAAKEPHETREAGAVWGKHAPPCAPEFIHPVPQVAEENALHLPVGVIVQPVLEPRGGGEENDGWVRKLMLWGRRGRRWRCHR